MNLIFLLIKYNELNVKSAVMSSLLNDIIVACTCKQKYK